MLPKKEFIKSEIFLRLQKEIPELSEVEIISINVKKNKGPLNADLIIKYKTYSNENYLFGKIHPGYRNEYDIMRKLWDNHYFKSNKYKIPKPIFELESCSLLVMEYLDGTIFKNQLYRSLLIPFSYFRVKDLKNKLDKCVDWLIDFESFTDIQYSNLENFTVPAIKKLENLNILEVSDINKIKSFLTNNNSEIEKVPLYFQNNDFKPQNIFLKTDSIIVFDWSASSNDFAFTMVYSFLRPFFVLQRFLFFSNSSMKKSISYFIEEYKKKTKFEDFDLIFPFMGIIYEINYLDRLINFRSNNWTRKKALETSLAKINGHIINFETQIRADFKETK